MISENKSFSMADLASVCNNLVDAKQYYLDQYNFYRLLLMKEIDPNRDAEFLPISPLGELYNRLTADALANYFTAGIRINALQGIADSTFLPGLDENNFLNNYPLER